MAVTHEITRNALRFADMLVTGSVEYAPKGWTQSKLEAALNEELARIERAGELPESMAKFVASARYVTGRGYVGLMSRKVALNEMSFARCYAWGK